MFSKLPLDVLRYYLGGELKPDRLHGLDRLIVSLVRRQIIAENERGSDMADCEYTRVLPEILPESVERFAAEIKQKLLKISNK